MFKERRKHSRFKTLDLVDVTYKAASDASAKGKDRGVVVNISKGGLAYASTKMFSRGDKVKFDFIGRDLRMSGMITRAEHGDTHYLHGVKFKWISYVNKGRLGNMIRRLYDKLVAARNNLTESGMNITQVKRRS